MELSKLSPPRGSRKKAKTVGRGEASGHGKTSCRGGKGQTARTGGGVRKGFEGGQMPLIRRIPKLGFRSRQKTRGLNQFALVSLSVLDRFSDGDVVDTAGLIAKGYKAAAKQKAGIKIVGGTEKFSKKLTVKVHAISEAAKKQIESAGGKVELLSSASESSQEASK